MQFHVPQFIDVEDKIFGKFSLAQVIYLAGAGGIAYMLYAKLFFPLNWLLPAGVIAFGAALAFFPTQTFGKPFIEIVESAFRFITRDRLYTWRRQEKKAQKVEELDIDTFAQTTVSLPNIAESKLKDISWSVDVKDKDNDEAVV